MISIADGIYLESSNELLRWGCTRAEAWHVGTPVRHLAGDDTRIRWHESLLDGLSCGLLAYLPDGALLDTVTVWLRPTEDAYRGDDEIFHYLRLFKHLVQQLGAPSSVQVGATTLYAPVLTWQHDGCIL